MKKNLHSMLTKAYLFDRDIDKHRPPLSVKLLQQTELDQGTQRATVG